MSLPSSTRRRHVRADIRRATADDLPAIALANSRAFGFHHNDVGLADFRPLFDPDRFLLARDLDDRDAGGPILGITGSFGFDVTLPGGATVPAPGVTWVSVAVTHRRRGILRALMEEQHRGFVADGVAVALLTASEGAIYGRFGYGTATVRRGLEITGRRATIRHGVPDPGGVRQVDGTEIRHVAPEIHRRWAAITPGAVSRSDAWWDNVLLDREWDRNGATALFHLLHPDGYASYRIANNDTFRITELVAATEEARAALWRVLLDLDLVETITASSFAIDDPLPFLLTDPRQVRTTRLVDGMWARILDVTAALAARRYAVELDVVLEVNDEFLDCGGCVRLRRGPHGATCEPVTGGGPLISIDIGALGSLLFGGERATTLARAGLVRTDDAAALQRLDAAFLAERAPQHGTEF